MVAVAENLPQIVSAGTSSAEPLTQQGKPRTKLLSVTPEIYMA